MGDRCEYEGQHPRIAEQIRQLEDRADKHDAAIDKVVASSAGVQRELAEIRGQLAGALAATKMSGAIIGSLVSIGGAGAVGLTLYLLQKGGHP